MDSAFYYGLSQSMKAHHSRNIAGRAEAYAELETYVAQLELALKVKRANVVGLDAELDLMHKLHPNSPAKAASSSRFKTGAVKNFGRISFENGFDKELRAQGIANPAQYRRD